MMITLNCGWGIPDEDVTQDKHSIQRGICSLNAAFGVECKPTWVANDNLPEYLSIVV